MSVALRVQRSSDDAWLASWLPAVAASVGYELDALQQGPRAALDATGSKRLIIEDGASPAGVVIWRPRAQHAAIVELVATPAEHARRGAGMRAAVLLEARLRKQRVCDVYAAAPAIHGIAMYFWIRLGYRPLLRTEWPCEREGVAWLMRRLD